MAKTYLTEDEVLKFPSVSSLLLRSYRYRFEEWGLCQKRSSVWFGEKNAQVRFVLSLQQILLTAENFFPDVDCERLHLYYAIDTKSGSVEHTLIHRDPLFSRFYQTFAPFGRVPVASDESRRMPTLKPRRKTRILH